MVYFLNDYLEIKLIIMKIAFHSNQLCLRGTSVALYDYAYYNRVFLNNDSIILYDKASAWNVDGAKQKFESKFQVTGYDNFSAVDKIIEKEKVDAIYMIKGGENDGKLPGSCKSLIHAVFAQPLENKHGSIFAFVSEWLSKECSNYKIPYVPHMINLLQTDENLRKDLNIPIDAVVIGRSGGIETFDIEFVHSAVKKVVNSRKNIYFLFQNTEPFYRHPHIIYLNGNSDLLYKTKFINTCDAMLHARKRGETFGLAIGEFSSCNKPVICYGNSPEKNHYMVLKDKGIYYSKEKELVKQLLGFEKSPEKNWNCFENFTPEKVMMKFKEVFLD
jgi:hypothetical protein